jgi:hypothetical protein
VETPYTSPGLAGGWAPREGGRSVCGLEMSEEANAAL